MHLLLAIAILAQVGPVRDSPKDWQLITTDHFNIYYPSDELLPRARQFAAWFEDARVRLVRKTGVEPRRINVFLYKSYLDLSQSSFFGRTEPLSARVRKPALQERFDVRSRGCMSCRPDGRRRALALAEPLRDRIFIHCQASDRWNAWFARHELAHHVQFAHLFPWTLPSWLIALKAPITPDWWWEGGADYLAGIFDSGKDQYMRDLAEERLYDLKEIYSFDVINPYDFVAHYYEGSYFWRFLDEQYGVDTGRRLFEAYDEGIPVPMQRPLKNATGKSREELEQEFADHLQAQWAPMMAGRGTPTDRLTDTRQYYRRRAWGGRWSPDGKRLAWVGDADVWPELYVDGSGMLGWRRGIDVGFVTSPPSWSPDGKRIVVAEWFMNHDVLDLVEVDGGLETIQLDPFDELYEPAWSPDGGRIAFSALKNGTSDIYVLHLSDRHVERITEDDDADSSPAWSPDGRLAWIKETEGRTVLHLQGKGAVTKSWALMDHPQWSPDGKSIVVSADVGGVYDAFAVDPETGAAKRLTKFRSGVSYPAYHPTDGSLLITYYQGRGMDLYRVRPEAQDEPAFDQEERKSWYDQFKKPAPQGAPAEKSRVFGMDAVMFPVTSASWLVPGFELQISDRDAENTFFAGGLAQGTDSWEVVATVVNTRWRPNIGVTAVAARDIDLFEWRVQPFVDVPLIPTFTVGVGWTVRERYDIVDGGPDPSFFDSGPTAAFIFSNQSGYQLHDAAWGFAFGGSWSYFSESLGGDRELRQYFAFFEASRDIVQDWILWTRLTYEKLVGRELLQPELIDLEPGSIYNRDGVRGAEDLEGTERGVATLELRFPIQRDLMWKPMEWMGLGEFLIIKDLRGFVFAQAGYAGTEASDAWGRDFGAVSAGVGLRLDISVMLWPLMNGRVPMRLEFWWAMVGQNDREPHEAVGFAVNFGF